MGFIIPCTFAVSVKCINLIKITYHLINPKKNSERSFKEDPLRHQSHYPRPAVMSSFLSVGWSFDSPMSNHQIG